jgi:hypothetical protein
MNCRVADFIGYSIFLEIFLEMRFLIAFGVPEKSVFTRLFSVFATDMLANFQGTIPCTHCKSSAQRQQGLVPALVYFITSESQCQVLFLCFGVFLVFFVLCSGIFAIGTRKLPKSHVLDGGLICR